MAHNCPRCGGRMKYNFETNGWDCFQGKKDRRKRCQTYINNPKKELKITTALEMYNNAM